MSKTIAEWGSERRSKQRSFVCGLFNDAIGISDYTAFNNWTVINKLERMRKEATVA
jgi:hypothetical protein